MDPHSRTDYSFIMKRAVGPKILARWAAGCARDLRPCVCRKDDVVWHRGVYCPGRHHSPSAERVQSVLPWLPDARLVTTDQDLVRYAGSHNNDSDTAHIFGAWTQAPEGVLRAFLTRKNTAARLITMALANELWDRAECLHKASATGSSGPRIGDIPELWIGFVVTGNTKALDWLVGNGLLLPENFAGSGSDLIMQAAHRGPFQCFKWVMEYSQWDADEYDPDRIIDALETTRKSLFGWYLDHQRQEVVASVLALEVTEATDFRRMDCIASCFHRRGLPLAGLLGAVTREARLNAMDQPRPKAMALRFVWKWDRK